MPSELSRQLGDFRTKNKVVPVVQKVSFLFDANRAAGLDIISLALIARKSLLKLSAVEPALETFEDLFTGTGKSVEFLEQDEAGELHQRMKSLLSFLSGHFKTLDGQQCLEYLIQKYHVHVYNSEELILFALPYHDTAMFGKLVQLIPFLKNVERANASETRWTFLRNVHKTGSPLSRLALVRMCRSSQPVMAVIIDHTIASLKYGAFNQALLSFVNVLLLEVLSDFDTIKFDISVPLFSLCRICFKAAHLSPAAFFVGLSVATHIVCVADVREDALGLLFSRAIAVCPDDKFYSLLMALTVVVARKPELPTTVVKALAEVDDEVVKSAINMSVSRFNSDLKSLVPVMPTGFESLVDEALRVVVESPAIDQPSVEPAAEESSDSSDEEDSLAGMRKELTALIAKGSKQARKAAVEKFAHLEGATRHCIRLSALCDSTDLLGLTMRGCKKDLGYVPCLIASLGGFKTSDARLVLEASVAEVPKLPSNAITEIAEALHIEYAGSLYAVIRNVESEFHLSEKVWMAVAALCAGPASQLGKSPLLTAWRTDLVPSKFLSKLSESKEALKDFTQTFITFANNPKVKIHSTSDPSLSALAQLVCSLTLPQPEIRKALSAFAKQSVENLSMEARTRLIVSVMQSGSPALFKKLNEFAVSEIEGENSELISAAEKTIVSGGSADSWSLVSQLMNNGLRVDSGVMLKGVEAAPSGAAALAAWRSLKAIDCTDSEIVCKIIDLVLQSISSLPVEAGAMLETLLAVTASQPEISSEKKISILKELLLIVVRKDVDDTITVMAQSVCESLVSADSWTLMIQVMANPVFENSERAAVQIRCLMLLAGLIGNEESDSELVTSKELGQVVLGLTDLVTCTASSGKDSWTELTNTDAELTGMIERVVVQFLLQCTLKKLDKFVRRVVVGVEGNDSKHALILRVYTSVCEQAGEAVTLALLPTVSDLILSALKSSESNKKRKRNQDLVVAGLAAVCASCVERTPETSIADLTDAVVAIVGSVDDVSAVSNACIALARAASSDQIKLMTKRLMQRTTENHNPLVQEAVLRIVLALWKQAGEVMVPAITEVTVFLNELYLSSETEVADATKALVKEMDRITGEDIENKLRGHSGDEDMDD
jgi:hypothetical protein